jgi:choline dehydrogenase-like flavoprotein
MSSVTWTPKLPDCRLLKMKIVDLNHLQRNSLLEADLCIVGSGPAGLSIANEFVGSDIRVLLLEGGGMKDEPETQALYDIENTGAQRLIDQSNLRRRILGGTSHIWTGRCAPFEDIDFQPRPWIPWSGWPVTLRDFAPYFERAGTYLGLGPNRYDESLWQSFGVDPPQPPLTSPSLRPAFWQFSKRPHSRESMRFGQDWVKSAAPNIEILLHANATHINLTDGGSAFESVEVSSLDGKRSRVKAKTMVLCCGAVENARLLLASNRKLAKGVGNQNDLVGRFLMDHTSISVASFDLKHAKAVRCRFGGYWLDDENGRHRFLHGLSLSPEAQEKERLVNCRAYLDEGVSAARDPWSALKRIKSSLSSGHIQGQDAWVVLSNLGEIGRGLYRRNLKHRPELGPVDQVKLELILEQVPDPESRVTLSEGTKDALGMPLSSLHWKIGDVERRTAQRMVELVGEEFKRLRLPAPRDVAPLQQNGDWTANFFERAHPTGTTRMSSKPNEGVVDENCQVHDIQGLFVSGSSVFPTSGAVNPTLMIVASALRLADFLKARHLQTPRRELACAELP